MTLDNLDASHSQEEAKQKAQEQKRAMPSGLDLMAGASADLNKLKSAAAAAANPEEIQIGMDDDVSMSDRQQQILDDVRAFGCCRGQMLIFVV